MKPHTNHAAVVPIESSRRGARRRILRVCAGWLGTVAFAACAGFESPNAPRVLDILVLATDGETARAFIAGMENVETGPTPHSARASWSSGLVQSANGKRDYTVLVGLGEERDRTRTNTILADAFAAWHPRYVLALGTALAAKHDASIGDVGIVALTCGFDLQRFEGSRDMGQCYRSDAGLFAAALSIADAWEVTAGSRPDREGCPTAKVIKVAALSGDGDPSPGAIDAASRISEEIHRAVILDRRGINAARAVEEFRYASREPIGFMMIRGVSEIGSLEDRDNQKAENVSTIAQAKPSEEACVARDTAEFAIELIHRGWPVSPSPRP